MKILFVLRHGGYVRNFESLLVELAERGHKVHVALGKKRMHWLADRTPPIVSLAERYANITHEIAPSARHALSRESQALRAVLNWLRYLQPEYERAPKLRGRAEGRLPKALRRAMLSTGAATSRGNTAWRRALSAAERALPRAPVIDTWLAEQAPDVVCVSPLVDLGTAQPDVLRAAHAVAIPTVHCVASWDNLTNKGLILGEPDLVTVWNEDQRKEAIVLHRQEPERVLATGAHSYDHWFGWLPRRSRKAFYHELGLDPQFDFVLFLGSSPFIAPDEVPFVRRWVEALRSSRDPWLRTIGVLVRPHPQNGNQWEAADLSDLQGVAVWPRGGADPVDTVSRDDYHDSLHFSEAVVGVNTSALIETAIVGRPVLTVLDDDFAATQCGTLHFEHLRRAGGGLLKEASSIPEHLDQLGSVLRGEDDFGRRNFAFLTAFVRPHGLHRRAAPILADAVEGAVSIGTRPSPGAPIVQRLAAKFFTALAAWRRFSTSSGLPRGTRPRLKPKHASGSTAGPPPEAGR